MAMTWHFLRSTRARYDQSSYTLPLEVATIMDISENQEREINRLKVQNTEEAQNIQCHEDLESHGHDPYDFDDGLGAVIGKVDPFEHAYVQPALRATSRARPEQPFPPAQLGREEKFLGYKVSLFNLFFSFVNDLFGIVKHLIFLKLKHLH